MTQKHLKGQQCVQQEPPVAKYSDGCQLYNIIGEQVTDEILKRATSQAVRSCDSTLEYKKQKKQRVIQ